MGQQEPFVPALGPGPHVIGLELQGTAEIYAPKKSNAGASSNNVFPDPKRSFQIPF